MCDTVFDAWPGAVIRNNLLYAAGQIQIKETGRSLREQIDTFPLPETHPLYKELKDGFPKGYVLTDFSHFDSSNPSGTLLKDEVFSFTLLLIGHFNDYRFYFFEAIRVMCERGIGKPMTPFQLREISENPSSPVTFTGFIQPEVEDCPSELTVNFLTPVILYRLKEKKNTLLSYQDKTNRFPSLFQLIRSSFSRLQKLDALYAEPSGDSSAHPDETAMEACLEKAGQPLLKAAGIRHVILPNTRKKEKKNEMPLAGYIGEQTYAGYFESYLPLLQFMSVIGVGNDTVYGMGRFAVTVQYSSNRMYERQKNEVESEEKIVDSFLQLPATDTGECLPKMLKLAQLTVRFKNHIIQGGIPLLINAISQEALKTGEQFYRHMVSGEQYAYPLIQFKRINGNAAIICIGEGTESIGGYFSSDSRQATVDGDRTTLEIETVKAKKTIVQAWDGNFTYSVRKYLPLSRLNYVAYQMITGENERRAFLEEIVRANISLFTKFIDIHIDREIVCYITELAEKAKVKYKNHTFASFDLKFRTNISLPDYIGLGIGVSHGFGMIASVRRQKNN